MNPGAAEEAGKAANTFMDIMRAQPLSLALVIMNVMLLALFYFFAVAARDTRRMEFQQLVEQQKETAQLLFKCIPAENLKELRQ
jgi:uncharacterized membrane protein (UPF0182 family)